MSLQYRHVTPLYHLWVITGSMLKAASPWSRTGAGENRVLCRVFSSLMVPLRTRLTAGLRRVASDQLA